MIKRNIGRIETVCSALLLDIIKALGVRMRVTLTDTLKQFPTRHSVYSCRVSSGSQENISRIIEENHRVHDDEVSVTTACE
jgi:hypothetical protein